MNNPYDLHSWSKHYRDDLLREVHSPHNISPTHSGGGAPSTQTRTSRIWLNILSLLGKRSRTELLE